MRSQYDATFEIIAGRVLGASMPRMQVVDDGRHDGSVSASCMEAGDKEAEEVLSSGVDRS